MCTYVIYSMYTLSILYPVDSMYTYVGVVVVYIYSMSVLDVLMCEGVGGLYLLSVYSMCA